MRRALAVVDDFYQNPLEVRKFALQLEYPEPDNTYTYPGKNSKGSWYSQEIHEKFEQLAGRKLIPAEENGYFRTSPKGCSFKQFIHVDNIWEYGAVIYLNTDEQLKNQKNSGTAFWQHKNLNFDMSPRTAEEADIFGYTQYKELSQSIIYGDGLDETKWDLYAKVIPRMNRMVFFRAWMYHSHNVNFGETLEDSRLVQLFFFTV